MANLAIQLVRICFDEASSPAGLSGRSPGEWHRALSLLDQHRLAPLLWYRLAQAGRGDVVPVEYREAIFKAYLDSQLKNRVTLLSLDGALVALGERDIEPIVMKGAFLADTFYPDLGTRPMQDVDLVIERERSADAYDALQGAGFRPRADSATEDAFYLVNDLKVMLDVHFGFRIYEGHGDLSMRVRPERLRRDVIRVFQPDAMVAHLAVHMHGHRAERGPMLIWYADLAFVLGRWGDRLDASRITSLMPSGGDRLHLGRTLAFLRDELGQPLPESVADLASTGSSDRIETMLAQRSMALWGLPEPRGWLRLLAARAGLGGRRAWPVPRGHELAAWVWHGAVRPRLLQLHERSGGPPTER